MEPQEPTPQALKGLSALPAKYSALLCDIWGVLHNGKDAFPDIANTLRRFRAERGPILLLSNAPRPGTTVQKRLNELGIGPDCYDDILTSGDAARLLIRERGLEGQICYHVGPEKDLDLIAGLDAPFGGLDEADYILLSGLYDDSTETPDDYIDLIATWHERNISLICANPDRVVQIGDQFIYCAGAVAEIFEQKGGHVIWLGKPNAIVYELALKKLNALGVDANQLLAVGDGPKTDVKGANLANIDVLFMSGGIASADSNFNHQSMTAIRDLLAKDQTHAHFAMKHLVW